MWLSPTLGHQVTICSSSFKVTPMVNINVGPTRGLSMSQAKGFFVRWHRAGWRFYDRTLCLIVLSICFITFNTGSYDDGTEGKCRWLFAGNTSRERVG